MLRLVIKNTLFLSISQILSRGIGFLYFVFLARYFGVELFGVYTFTLSFVYNFIPIADFGIERFVLRDISRDHDLANYYLVRLVPIRLLLAVGAYIFCLLLGVILHQTGTQLIYFAIFGLAIIPQNITFLIANILNAKEKMRYMALANIILILLTSGLGVLLVYFKAGLPLVLFSYSISNILLCLIFLFSLKNWGLKLGWVFDKSFFKKTLKESWVFALILILAVFYLRLSTIMLGLLKGSEAVGLYNSVYKFIEAGILIPQSFALALFPISSRLFIENKKKLKNIYIKGLGILFLLSLPISFLFIFFPKLIINISYGTAFLPAASIFKIFGLAIIIFFINSLAGTIIQNSTKVKYFLPLSILNFVIVFILCLLFIPSHGIVGAAWAVVGGEFAGLIINNIFIYKILKND